MASAEAAFGGSSGGQFRLHLQVDEVAVDVGNNRSLVNVSLYIYALSTGTGVWNLFASGPNAPGGNIVVNGNQINFLHTYDFRGNAGPVYLISNYQQWINHNGDGTKSIGVSGFFNGNNSPYLTTSSVGLTINLTNIPRYANITNFTVTNVHDEGFNINVTVDAVCDLLQYTIDGGASWQQVPGDFTSRTVELHNLPSGRDYAVIVWVRRKDSGLATQSGAIGVTTPEQGKWLAFF